MSFEIDIARRIGERDITLSLSGGEGATVLVGRSGAGKTSVLNMIAGLLTPDRGRIVVAGETLFDAAAGIDVAPRRRRVGYVFQEARLFSHRRVRANLLYGAPEGADLDATAAMLGIAPLLDRWPRTLSGGEARRVAIGRALLSDPRFLLLDEPLSSLDRPRREDVMRAIERVRDEAGLPILMVTHDPEEAARIGTRIVEMR
ncbi:molybdate transport system ATP-binding protein [Sphingomonas jinjuensis]|uniref:Molybdate transport system ATP-binding protein n=1 Tax=Sphingomonas jinjuensis TaxID=535907 RepID=A0A840FGA8_9SPHN|nr:ATP-binding cassette domain-containing protein [Sphingomonas jinjuensis]MBB4154754.1 molybdate transport system ATP-binding protein [Sphingomonas jinjuensis]